ncbi:MAG: 16S rRNA (guanine(527)-N(7))-methyltransferase RsmG [Roseburia sp.]|nr:16S rRNA (guanine(527)-N(7))-methyltransferase RsmG [Roseburia sp.]
MAMELGVYEKLLQGELNEKFSLFKDILFEYNNKFNLTAITDEKGVYIKHFLDCMAGDMFFERGAEVAEIGSGGGFPSIPLKILRDDLSFTLIESTAKKCGYLQDVVDKLKLNCVQVVNGRAEVLGKDKNFREKFDAVTARAVARLNVLCEYCLPFIKEGGVFVAYKGDCGQEITEAEKAISVLGGETERIEKYTLLNGDKRTLVVIRKVKKTPEKYPRGQGKERKNPII